jgi:hypothetical protein
MNVSYLSNSKVEMLIANNQEISSFGILGINLVDDEVVIVTEYDIPSECGFEELTEKLKTEAVKYFN